MQRRAAEPVVAEDAVAGAPSATSSAPEAELLEGADLRRGRAVHLLELQRWSKAKTRISDQSPPCSRWRLVAQCTCSSAASLRRSGGRRRGRGRTRARPATDRPGCSRGARRRRRRRRWRTSGWSASPGRSASPEQAGEEAVAGAEDVEDLDREAGAGLAVVEARGSRPRRRPRPAAPRLQTSVASETARTARSAAMVSVEPPAMWNSSSVPTIRSKRCSVDCSFRVTSALSTKRLSPSPWPATPQRFGR